jgi:hypothetical protein
VAFRHACKLRLEGMVSKHRGSPDRSGRSQIGSNADSGGVACNVTRSRTGEKRGRNEKSPHHSNAEAFFLT